MERIYIQKDIAHVWPNDLAEGGRSRPINQRSQLSTPMYYVQSQGAPEFGPQNFFIENMQKAAQETVNEECDSKGIPELRKPIANFHQRQYGKLNHDQNIIVTAGASVALFCLFMTFIDPQDQVLLFQPAFDFYRHYATIFKAKTQNVKLILNDKKSRSEVKQMVENNKVEAKNWQIDWKSLEQKLTEKVKMIIINSPQNPTGKFFTQEEIDRICQMALKLPNLIIIEDCVYEGFMFDEFKGKYLPKVIHSKHYPLLKQRVLNVYSGGKLLEATGIRCGWVIGQTDIISLIHKYHTTMLESVSYMVQKATAYCLDDIVREQYYYLDLEVARSEHHRMELLKSLSNSKYNFKITIPKSGYFILVDISEIEIKEQYFTFRLEEGQTKNPRDLAFCYQMAFEDGVVIVPCSSFFSIQNKEENYIRFALCKNLNAIREAGLKLHA